jgi:peptidoglycan/LPS O-acetylase OafA/YrhL
MMSHPEFDIVGKPLIVLSNKDVYDIIKTEGYFCSQQKMVALIMRVFFLRVQRLFQFISSWISLQLDEKKTQGTIGALDGVRAIACLTIVAYHITLMTHNNHVWSTNGIPLTSAILLAGAAGVTLFFVLSGFLLFLPYARALLFEQHWPDAHLFYLRRALRIMPAYYFSLFILIMFTHANYIEPQNWQKLVLFLFLFQDSTQMTYAQLNGPFWTLAVEWQFYLFLPLIAWGIHVLIKRIHVRQRLWGLIVCLVVLMAWGMFSRPVGNYFISHPHATILVPRSIFNVFLFFTYGYQGKYLEDFAVGMLVCVLFVYLNDKTTKVRHLQSIQRLSVWIWRIGILLLLFVAMESYMDTFHYRWPILVDLPHMQSWQYEIGFALGYGFCVIAILFDTSGLQWFFSRKPLCRIGTISYSVYIWHLPLLIVFLVHFGFHFGKINPYLALFFYWSWVVLVIIPFCFLLYILIEKPGMRLSDRLRKHIQRHQMLVSQAKGPSPTATVSHSTRAVSQHQGAAISPQDMIRLGPPNMREDP